MKKETLIKLTKYFLDVMFLLGIVVTLTLPWSLKWVGTYIPRVAANYQEIVIIYFVLGVAALAIIRELRKMFKTVIDKDCFVRDNVISLNKMFKWSLFIVAFSLVRCVVYLTIAMFVVIIVFVVAGLFSKVLAFVFEEAIEFKEENDLTI